ncbi:hypothetical protein CAPTEDRAFT_215165 [Capitella teleta]|uniref:MADF domain-containing protein n=1 Tax=Capitella teleta TaxID=283909 RepID=R7V499_CAPTE|nr:hypothetical protein CAPTEDRAFT_215165 [Capitella teleta]|eukprot:ELU10630.1 hypothetical protein CAPTEDRAFT_215165 [Capitella teleta]
MASSMTREEIAQLAANVEENSCLYDPSDPYYKDAVVVKNTWDNVARGFWRKKYRGFRDAFARSQKKALMDGYVMKPYKFVKEFHFLEPFLKHHDVEGKTFYESTTVFNEQEDEDGSNGSWAESVDGNNDTSFNTSAVKTEKRGIKRPRSSPKKTFRKFDPSENNNEDEDDGFNMSDVVNDPSVNEGELFFSSCAKRMKNYAKSTQELIYLQVSEVFFNASNHEKGLPCKPMTPFNSESS